MKLVTNLFQSSLGRKYVMAVSGGALFVFVTAHMLGNLQIFLGQEAINRYGHFLQSNKEILWASRLGLLAMVGLHIWSAISLTLENRKARPVAYTTWDPTTASYASRTMMVSGLIVAAFILYHLLHFTAQTEQVNLTGQDFTEFRDDQDRHDVFRMMVTGFRQPVVAGFYIVAVALLCTHLSHGARSLFQSFGWKNKTYAPLIHRFAALAAWLIFLGYVSIPVAVLLGYGKEVLK